MGRPRRSGTSSPPKKPRTKSRAKGKKDAGDAPLSPSLPKPVAQRAVGKRKVTATKRAAAAEDGGDDDDASSGPRIYWDKDPSRTERLLDWLTNNPDERHKLFSDSTQAANEEGRPKKKAKTAKTQYYAKMAHAVFSVDEDDKVRDHFNSSPARYARVVENYIGRLKTSYRDFNTQLGQTGAGLRAEEIIPGSEIANKIDLMKESFPWWDRLHGFWRTLPNFNPHTASSEPGQDFANQALAIVMGDSFSGDMSHVGAAGTESDSVANGESQPWDIEDEEKEHGDDHTLLSDDDTPKTPKRTSVVDDLDADGSEVHITPPPPPKFQLPAKGHFKLSAKGNSASNNSTPSSSSGTAPVKTRGKRTRAEAFADENKMQTETLAALASQKHERRLAELDIKKQRLQLTLLEKQQMFQRDAQLAEERRAAAEERRREAEFMREREREKYHWQLAMLRQRSQAAMQGDNFNFENGLGGIDMMNMAGGQFMGSGAGMGGMMDNTGN